MTLEELKTKIENKSVSDDMLVFVYKDTDFIPMQYINQIAKDKHLEIEYIDDLDSFIYGTQSIFYTYDNDKLNVYRGKEVSKIDTNIKNLYIVCTKYSGTDGISIPKLEDWQIKDYVYTTLPGVAHSDLDWLISLCKNDMYRINLEVSKLSIFSQQEQKSVFKSFVDSGMYSDLSDKTIFDFSNAIQVKDLEKLHMVYRDFENADIEPLGLVSILYGNFKKMIMIWCANNQTADQLGVSSSQFWAIKKLPKKYSYDQLVSSFELISRIEYMLKMGTIAESDIVDYLTIKLLSF